MKDDKTLSSSLRAEPSLPADFAQRVILIAAGKLRWRRRRNRVGGALLLLVIGAIPVATAMRSHRESSDRPDSGHFTESQLYADAADNALAFQLSRAGGVPSAGDYLLPNAAELNSFISPYNETSWQSDSFSTDSP